MKLPIRYMCDKCSRKEFYASQSAKQFLNVVFVGAGRIIAVGVGGNLQRADSEAVLVETAEPINCDTESGRISVE
jgi:hypothetical protein